MVKRLRIVAGPNGSGKSHLTKWLQGTYALRFDNYINADEIEAALHKRGSFDFAPYSIETNTQQLRTFYDAHPLGKEKGLLSIRKNKLMLQDDMPPMGYVGAVVADYVRRDLMRREESFSFETVMSGKDKLALLEEAKENGYRIYLYFVCTEDPQINVARVAERVLAGGHDVPEDLIRKRYLNTLNNLYPAIKLATRAYIFDNSGRGHRLVAECHEGKLSFELEETAGWFREHVLKIVAG